MCIGLFPMVNLVGQRPPLIADRSQRQGILDKAAAHFVTRILKNRSTKEGGFDLSLGSRASIGTGWNL